MGSTGGVHHPLGHGFIHRQGGGQIPAAGIADAQQVEGRLDAAILAVLAVKAQEHDIRQAAQLQHMGAQQPAALVLPAGLHRLEIRGRGIDPHIGAQPIQRVKQRLRVLRQRLHA